MIIGQEQGRHQLMPEVRQGRHQEYIAHPLRLTHPTELMPVTIPVHPTRLLGHIPALQQLRGGLMIQGLLLHARLLLRPLITGTHPTTGMEIIPGITGIHNRYLTDFFQEVLVRYGQLVI